MSILVKALLALAVTALHTSLALAQVPELSSAAPITTPTAKQDPAESILGVLKERAQAGTVTSDFCRLESSRKLPSGSIVLVVRKAPCTGRYASSQRDFLEVLFGGKTFQVAADAVYLTEMDLKRLDTLDAAQLEASAEAWRANSIHIRKDELERALKAVESTGKYGIALLTSGIFDISEYTEGTGFRATVLNSTKKPIKYVTFNVVGLNAVGDPVRGGLGRTGPSAVLRGIGPIEPDESASYSRDYMWMTDIVEAFRISSIKVEYMDGSSRAISNVKAITLSEAVSETILVDD